MDAPDISIWRLTERLLQMPYPTLPCRERVGDRIGVIACV
jgi:hypothetical protein